MLHMAGDVDAGDLSPVPLRKSHDIVLALVLKDREGGVDKDPVGGGDLVQHPLQGLDIGEGLAAGKDEVTGRGDGIHPTDALQDLLQGEAGHVGILLFIDAERTVVLAVVGNKDRDGSAALSGFIRMTHVDCLSCC